MTEERELSRIFNLCYEGEFIMPINKRELTKEQIMKAIECKTAEELITLAKSEGIEITEAEAEAYLAELSECEIKDGQLRHVAGGVLPKNQTCVNDGYF